MPMLNWLEMLRAPSVEEVGVTHLSLNTYSVPSAQRRAENTMVKRTNLPSWRGRQTKESQK